MCPTLNYEKWLLHYGLELLRSLCEKGLSEEEIAERVGLSLGQMRRWKEKYVEFRSALSLGHPDSDFHVINALYKKATGFNVELKKTYKLKTVEFDPDTGKKIREYEELATGVDETFIPADLSAEKYWLENRQSERWGKKVGENDDGEGGGAVLLVEADALDGFSPMSEDRVFGSDTKTGGEDKDGE